MIATIFIIGVSLTLFVYWFRYTCLLIVSAKTTRDYAGEIATANQLSFLTVREQLRSSADLASLERLIGMLDRDYAVVTYLLEHASEAKFSGDSLEQQMLRINYRVMRVWYRISRSFSLAQARQALDEMSLVVAHFANTMGERAAYATQL